jgi:hypothetical protein
VSPDELRDLLILTINRNSSTLNASPIEGTGVKAVVGVENEETGDLFLLEIAEA